MRILLFVVVLALGVVAGALAQPFAEGFASGAELGVAVPGWFGSLVSGLVVGLLTPFVMRRRRS